MYFEKYFPEWNYGSILVKIRFSGHSRRFFEFERLIYIQEQGILCLEPESRFRQRCGNFPENRAGKI